MTLGTGIVPDGLRSRPEATVLDREAGGERQSA